MIARTISPIHRSPAPTVDHHGCALSFQCGFTNATDGSPPARRATTNSDASLMCPRPSGVSMIRFTYWNGLWCGTSPLLTASAPAPQPAAYHRHVTPAASSRSAMVGTVCGVVRISGTRCGGYGGSRLLTT